MRRHPSKGIAWRWDSEYAAFTASIEAVPAGIRIPVCAARRAQTRREVGAQSLWTSYER